MSSDARRPLALALAASLALDQVSKWWVLEILSLDERGLIDVAPPYLRFVMGWNRGVNFGLGASDAEWTRWALIALALAISAGVAMWALRRGGVWLGLGAGLVVGGALGNAIDRVRFGAVADFLNMSCCGLRNPYAFNIADVAIFGGAAVLILAGGERRA